MAGWGSQVSTDVIIIGGGIIGCSLAESLSAEGLDVTLLERGLLGREASWAAAGMLAPQSEMLEPGPYMDFCLESRRLYPEVVARIKAQTSIDPQYRDAGMLYIAFTEEEEATIRERAAWQSRLGLEAETLDADEVVRREPAVTPKLRMAAHFGEDHQLDPRLMTRGYAVAARQNGAQLLEYSPVLGLLSDGGRVVGVEIPRRKIHAKWVVLAGGCWSGLLAGLAPALPTYPVKGQVLLLQAAQPLFSHTLHSSGVYLVPRHDGRVVVGATEEHEAGFDKEVIGGAVAELLGSAFEVAPALRDASLVDSWAGLRPGTPDRRPILGRCGVDGLLMATGHFRNGILLAPLTARLLSEAIVSGRCSEKLDPFSIGRFEPRAPRPVRA